MSYIILVTSVYQYKYTYVLYYHSSYLHLVEVHVRCIT